jgi:cation:H+ antiporter
MISKGEITPMHMDDRQMEEILLTAAQSLFAVAVLANLNFSLLEAVAIFVLFATQLMIPDPRFRMYYSLLYIVLTAGLLFFNGENRRAALKLYQRPSSHS